MPYHLVACELYNKNIHGGTSYEHNYLEGSYFIVFTEEDVIPKINEESVTNIVNLQYMCYDYYTLFIDHVHLHTLQHHAYIRNYDNIISNINYIKPEIALCLTLEGGERVAILKTFWIRIIQRVWKKTLAQRRNQIITHRSRPTNLRHREICGRWSEDFRPLTTTTLRGMLYSLN
jgi:hypothetical protein